MPQIKSSIKSMKTDAERRAQSAAVKSRIRTAIKKTLQTAEAGDADAARKEFSNTARIIDKAASKGVIHKNNAARKKSRLQAHLQEAESK